MNEIKSKLPYVLFKSGDSEYRLKFSAGAAVDTEKRLKCSVIDAVSKIDSITVQIALLFGALQKYHHEISMSDTEKIYEKYLDNGGSVLEFAEILMEVYIISGFTKKEQGEKAMKIMESMNTTV